MSELKDDLAALKIERTPEKIGRRGGLPIGWIVALIWACKTERVVYVQNVQRY